MINKILDLLSKIFNKNRKYFKDFFSKVWEILFKPEMCFLPGHLAFSVILSVVPVLSIITAIASSFGLTVEDLSSFLNRIFSSINFEVIVPNIMGQEISLKYISVICILFFIAANGASSIIVASDQIYGIKQTSYLKRRMKAIIMTMLLCILYICFNSSFVRK